MVSGAVLVLTGRALFRAGDQDWTPETAEILHMFEGKAQMIRFGGADLPRVEVN